MASWSVEEPEQIVNLLTELSRTTQNNDKPVY
jgi:hypothetical protein